MKCSDNNRHEEMEEDWVYTPPHKDAAEYVRQKQLKRTSDAEDIFVVHVVLDDEDDGQGLSQLRVIPMSHNLRTLSKKLKITDSHFEDLNLKIGDILLMSSFLTHCASKHVNNEINRHSFDFR